MAVNIPRLGDARIYAYSYDQLNRITAMDAYSGLTGSNAFTPVVLDDYKERISYDANGNILTYSRNGNKAGAQKEMDKLTYNYKNNTNQLVQVRDAVPATNYTEDIDDQPANNYDYDAIGNLIKDNAEGITEIRWTVYGKIESISKTDGTAIAYSYDAAGNRISKAVTKAGNTATTAYIRDARGNTLSVYEQNSALNSGHFTQSELHLYGSSRLGIYNLNKDLTTTTPAPINMGYGNSGALSIFERRKKFFELTNHLGNVLATVSDEKIGVDLNSDGVIDYYAADVVSANDYYPFGMTMPGRSFVTPTPGGVYRYGFNGKENDKDITAGAQDYGMRISDSRLGRFLSVDPLTKKYPGLTPYQYASNSPISGVDADGLEYVFYGLLAGKDGNVGIYKADEKDVVYQMNMIATTMTGDKVVIPKTFKLSDVGIKERFISDGKQVYHIPDSYDMSQPFPPPGDPAWSNFTTLAQYKKDFLERANFYLDNAENIADIIQVMASGGAFSRHSNFKARMKFAKEEANALKRYDGPKPKYHVNEKHVKLRRGQNATKLPTDAEDVFKNVVPDDPMKPKHWYGKNKDGSIYRFTSSNDGKAHFSGRSDEGDGIKNMTEYAKERLNNLGNN